MTENCKKYPAENMVSKVFGKWLVLREIKKEKQSSKHYECRCACGTIRIIPGHTLRQKNSTQCIDCARTQKHCMSRTRVYKIWGGILNRCNNPNSTIYNWYGKKGIQVCERWLKFENFYADMGNPPSEKMEIDRINGHGNYEPTNCRWVTRQENIKNITFIDTLAGKKFNKWTIVKHIKNNPSKDHRFYECKCDCGTVSILCGTDVKHGRTKQCRLCKNKAHMGWFARYKKAYQIA